MSVKTDQAQTLRRVRVAPREPVVPPVATPIPPVPTRPGRAEPHRTAPDHAPSTTAHGTRPEAGWWRRLRSRLADLQGRIARDAWAAGYRGGYGVGRAETQQELRTVLLEGVRQGRYDFLDGNAAAREILARLDQESQSYQRKDAT